MDLDDIIGMSEEALDELLAVDPPPDSDRPPKSIPRDDPDFCAFCGSSHCEPLVCQL